METLRTFEESIAVCQNQIATPTSDAHGPGVAEDRSDVQDGHVAVACLTERTDDCFVAVECLRVSPYDPKSKPVNGKTFVRGEIAFSSF